MNDDILKLIKVICSLYFERLVKEDLDKVISISQETLSGIKVNNANVGVLGSEDSIKLALRNTGDWLLNTREEGPVSIDNLKQRLRINLTGNKTYMDMVLGYLEDVKEGDDDEVYKKKADEIAREIRYDQKKSKLSELIQKANRQLMFDGEYVETSKFVREVMDSLEKLNSINEGEAPGFVGSIDFSNSKEVMEALEKSAEINSSEGLIKTGLEGFDDATGIGGFRRGDLINYAARTGCYKSGLLIDIPILVPVVNDPYMYDEEKKPAIVRFSYENTIEQDIGIIYSRIFELTTGEKADMSEIDLDYAVKMITDHFESNGYYFFMESFDPNNHGVYDLLDRIDSYGEMGYEVHLVACDYLHQIAHNTMGERDDLKILRTFEMVRNHCYPKGITFLTGHQLNTTTAEVVSEYKTTACKHLIELAPYQSTKALNTKLDVEFMGNIFTHADGNKYLEVIIGKNRTCTSTPESAKHFYYKFNPIGGIIPECYGGDKPLKSIPKITGTEDIDLF